MYPKKSFGWILIDDDTDEEDETDEPIISDPFIDSNENPVDNGRTSIQLEGHLKRFLFLF